MTTPTNGAPDRVLDADVGLREIAADRHPSIQCVTRFFEYGHLPSHLQEVSAPFADVARLLLTYVTIDDPEVTVALRKLLEAKDAAVRAAVVTR